MIASLVAVLPLIMSINSPPNLITAQTCFNASFVNASSSNSKRQPTCLGSTKVSFHTNSKGNKIPKMCIFIQKDNKKALNLSKENKDMDLNDLLQANAELVN